MKISSDRALTTHTGSLPRPASLTDRHDRQAVRAAVADTVGRQLAAGVDVVNDGEASKPSYSTYVTERLSGFGGEPVIVPRWGYEDFPEYARKQWGDAAAGGSGQRARRGRAAQRLEALDYATRDIPGEAMRLHLCWGNYEGPHHTDIPLADIIDLVLQARAMASPPWPRAHGWPARGCGPTRGNAVLAR